MTTSLYTIAITGGPCSGKTTVQDALKQEFGPHLLHMPEVATILLTNGYPRPGIDTAPSDQWFHSFQKVVIPFQQNMEDQYLVMAQEKGAKGVVFDRGLIDGAAYMPGSNEAYFEAFQITPEDAYKRYDLIIHLESVANCRPELYKDLMLNNEARYETLEEAQERDRRLQDVWRHHPNWQFIPGEPGIEHVLSTTLNLLRPHIPSYKPHE